MKKLGLLALPFVLAACDNLPPAPKAEGVRNPRAALSVLGGLNVPIPQFPEVDSVRASRITPGGPERSPTDLVAAVRSANGRVIIGIKSPAAPRSRVTGIVPAMSRAMALGARDSLSKHVLKLVRTFRTSADIVAEINPDDADRIRKLPFVDYVVPDQIYSLAQSTQDTAWGIKKIRAPQVWTGYFNAGIGATINIIDSGVDSTHVNDSSLDGPQNLFGCYYDPSIESTCYQENPVHGSFVAGVISARTNSVGYVGVAYDPYAFNSFRACISTGCPESAILGALDYIISAGGLHQIINMSLGGCYYSQAQEAKINQALNAGFLIIAAAGNTNTSCPGNSQVTDPGVLYPAKYSGVVAVSGSTENDTFADPNYYYGCAGSRYGNEVSLAAPFQTTSMTAGGYWSNNCGTSFSAPHVAGVAAMVWTQNQAFSALQVRLRMHATAVDGGSTGWDDHFGYGRVDAYSAISYTPPPLSVSISGRSTVKPNVSCEWTAVPSGGTTPYTYSWTKNGSYAGSGSSLTTSFSSSGTLGVQVTDGAASQASGSKSITVTSNTTTCAQ